MINEAYKTHSDGIKKVHSYNKEKGNVFDK